MLEITTMTQEDIAFARQLTDSEKWGNLGSDFSRLIYLDPKSCYIARYKNIPAGMITTVNFGDLVFLGNLIVIKEMRGRGIGRALMEQGIDYARSKGAKTIELDGDFPVVPLYRKLGFRDKYLSLRFIRKGDNNNTDKTDLGLIDLKNYIIRNIPKFDNQMTKINRRKLIEEYLKTYNNYIYIINNGEISAYSIVKPRSGDFSLIGPTVSKTTKDADMLFQRIIVDYGSKFLKAGVPEFNKIAVDILLSHEFNYDPPSLRMYLGERLDYEQKNYYTIISGDVG